MTRPASAGQLRFFLLDQQAGRATLVKRVTVDGPVAAHRLVTAVRTVLEAQPALRTSLHLEEDGLQQQVHPAADVELSVQHTDHAGEPAVLQEASHWAGARFVHGGGPLCRVRVVIGPDRAHCLFGVHHAVFDDDSADILLRALITAYEHGPASVPPAGDPAPAPDADRLAVLRTFWARALDGCPQDTGLPQLEDTRRRERGSLVLPLDRTLTDRMTACAREYGATPFTQLIAAAGMVVGWYLGRDDVVIATVTGGRTASDQNVIGCVQNTVPVRLDLAGADTAGLLDRTLDALYDAVEHADLPIEEILTVSGAARRPGHKPLTQILCAQGRVAPPTNAAGLRWQMAEPPGTAVEYDLSLALLHSAEGRLSLAVEYPAAAMSTVTAERVADHLVRALAALTSETARPLAEVPLLGTDEIAELALLTAESATVTGRPVHELVAEQARRTPDAVAVTANGESVGYAELDHRARRLAAELTAVGVRPGAHVGVCLPRGIDMVVALIAVWRAGAAYVPLDPEYPADRLRYMADDAELTALISDDDVVPGVRRVSTGASGATLPAAWPEVSSQDAAYLIYTSGSTGRPKGVLIRHANLSALFAAFDRELGGPPAVTVAGTSLSFDISALELFWPLARGRSVFVTGHRRVRQDAVPDGALYQCTPTAARILAADPEGRQLLGRLGSLLLGGEPLPSDLADDLAGLVPGPVFNCYGPTETTVWSTLWRVRAGSPVHIGRPLAGERCHVVNANGRPVPPGCPGRLRVSGSGVGVGYWRRPELTAERFRPLSPDSADLTYDTGDGAVLDPEHGLRFLGREDNQVKILGQRVETEEIESALRATPDVHDAAVVVLPEQSLITAFLVTADEPAAVAAPPEAASTPSVPAAAFIDSVCRHAAAWLPAAVIPTVWRTVPRLPQLPNGKLDRTTLRMWAEAADSVPQPSRGPATAPLLLAHVTDVWSHVLGKPVTDLDASFFELGGNSHGALRIFAALSGSFPALQAADLFHHTTVRKLATHLARTRTATPPGPAPASPAEGRGTERARALSGWGARPRRSR
ncbi:non-ribosomal peptide synthetase [Streptomyces chattanoogensis]|uniref:Carrier domain-containing protein n=1 Tax=Streptomyces chattanoogensis TaxID=66876 RepID=A0A0N1JX44_9ACTN|nr:non-ribosomal peptide synthetase [Streptomyces chattanoogensis]KPC61303.1 hypothetical protein ADL29_24800 [Streptomyces chattanoogensis]